MSNERKPWTYKHIKLKFKAYLFLYFSFSMLMLIFQFKNIIYFEYNVCQTTRSETVL
jgi:hypothetical protein